jgi:adenylosuccinate synthase
MINGVTQLAITKIDVLDHFDSFKAGYAYQSDNGETRQLPFDLCSSALTPKWTTFNGWKCDLAVFKKYPELPREVKNYISFLEKELEVPVRMISTGAERDKLIQKLG